MTDTLDPAVAAMWRAARRLGRARGGVNRLPPLWLFTDPARVADPVAAAERLPRGAGVVFRHFGASDAEATARRLAEVARTRGVTLLIGADAGLAEAVGAAGVHLPERAMTHAGELRRAYPHWWVTAAAHSRVALLRVDRFELDAVFVSPVFASDSPSAETPLGVWRLRRWVAATRTPVIALGGVNAVTIRELGKTGVAGVAAVSALAR